MEKKTEDAVGMFWETIHKIAEKKTEPLLEKIEQLGKEIKDIKNNTYNITINTHGYDTKSPEEFAEKFIKAIKEKGNI